MGAGKNRSKKVGWPVAKEARVMSSRKEKTNVGGKRKGFFSFYRGKKK
jgi:hypothetical protein